MDFEPTHLGKQVATHTRNHACVVMGMIEVAPTNRLGSTAERTGACTYSANGAIMFLVYPSPPPLSLLLYPPLLSADTPDDDMGSHEGDQTRETLPLPHLSLSYFLPSFYTPLTPTSHTLHISLPPKLTTHSPSSLSLFPPSRFPAI